MKWISCLLAVTLLSGCQRRDETVREDLQEAGYQLTTDDWFRASRGSDVVALKKFVAAKFPADRRDAAGDSALHAAAAAGAQAAADYLLDRGVEIDLRGASGRTPLMAAVLANQTEMTRWLLKQGADPKLKDAQGFKPLMLAVREGSTGAVEELAASNRDDLDPALLLAALVGRADVIDALTNFGASIHARMEDGRTPLMLAAQNGHPAAVGLLLEIGSSRFTTDPEGRTAADLAGTAGHADIVALISREPSPEDLALESPAEIAGEMDAFVETAVAKSGSKTPKRGGGAIPIQGETLGSPPVGAPPLVMRHYREKEVPLAVRSVKGETAIVTVGGSSPRELKLRVGDRVADSQLVVVRVQKRMEDSKLSAGAPTEISVMEVRDATTGGSREWISGVPSKAHDPAALVEDAATGRRYLAFPGQRFKTADGTEYLISDIRPNQMVLQETASGAVRTIPLRGPRG